VELSPDPVLWSVNLNRPCSCHLEVGGCDQSRRCARLFDVNCGMLQWAVIGQRIDATHPAFANARRARICSRKNPLLFSSKRGGRESDARDQYLRFTRLREQLSVQIDAQGEVVFAGPEELEQVQALKAGLTSGRMLDWPSLEPLLRVPHTPDDYRRPGHEHGTHVAGILAGDWRVKDTPPRRTSTICRAFVPT